MPDLTRRQLLAMGGASVLALAAGGRVLHQQLGSAATGHAPYFDRLSRALDQLPEKRPLLVIDPQRAGANLALMKKRLGEQYHFRLVAKSLPSPQLLEWLMTRADTQRLMLFNEPFLSQTVRRFPGSDILMGKPLPRAAAEHFYRQQPQQNGFDPARQLQWLIDTPQRLSEYSTLASSLEQTLRLSLEINIGMERGGFDHPDQLAPVLSAIEADPFLELGGFMGYEAHIAQAPGSMQGHFRKATERYQAFVETAERVLQRDLRHLTLNTGGSTTYSLYQDASVVANEIAAGSGILQPTDFDLSTLQGHQPAAFIAAPVLKSRQGLQLPGAPGVGTLMGWWDRRYRQTFFIDGGYWKARPASPRGLTFNPLYGRSSNQEMLNGPDDLALSPGDWVFLRPTQSEQVLMMFGDLQRYDEESGGFLPPWPVFRRQAGNGNEPLS